MTTTEKDRARVAYDRLARQQERTFGVPYPPERAPARAKLPPTPAHWAGPNLRVEHRGGCTGSRLESTAWHDANSGTRLLVVTACVDCGGSAQRRFPDAP